MEFQARVQSMDKTILSERGEQYTDSSGNKHSRRWRLSANGRGEEWEYQVITLIEVDGVSTMNEWGGYPTRHAGQSKYIEKLWG